MVLLFASSVASLGLGDKKLMGNDAVAIAGPAVTPLHVDVDDMAVGARWLESGVERSESADSIMRTSSVADLLAQVRTERSRGPLSREALVDATGTELETPARARFAAGLLVGFAATSYAR